jgi:hypothetical protein
MPRRDFVSVANVISFAKFSSRSHDAVIRVYDEAGNVIATHEQAGEFKRVLSFYSHHVALPLRISSE